MCLLLKVIIILGKLFCRQYDNTMNYLYLVVLFGLMVFLNSGKIIFLLDKPHYNI